VRRAPYADGRSALLPHSDDDSDSSSEDSAPARQRECAAACREAKTC
jgi:hypothetical protein